MSHRGQEFARAVARFADRSFTRPLGNALVTLLLMSMAAAAVSRVEIDPSPEALLEGSQSWAHYQALDSAYEIGETLVVALRERGGTVFDVETVSAVAELDRVLHELDGVERVLSLATATTLSRRQDVVDLRPIIDSEPLTAETALDLGRRIRQHPVYSQILVDARHETTFLFVQLPSSHPAEDRLATARTIREEVDRFRSKHRTVHAAGSPVLKVALADNFTHDILLFVPAALALLAVLLWFVFGDFASSVVPLVIGGGASMFALAALAAFGGINFATAYVPAIVLTVGVAECVHFLVEARRQYARIGERRPALLATVESIALPSLLTTGASALAFLVLSTSDIAPLRHVGFASAIGLVALYPLLVLVLPTVLFFVNYPRRRVGLFPAAPILGERVGRLAERAKERSVVTLAIAGLLIGGCFAILSGLTIDADYVALLPREDRLQRDIAIIEKTLGGTDVVEVILDAKEPALFKTPRGLKLLDGLAHDLRNFNGVSRVFSLADYLRLANAVINDGVMGDDAPLPATAEAIAQLELLDPVAFATLASDDQSQARLTIQVRTMSSDDVLRLTQLAEQTAGINLESTGVTAIFTGLPSLFARSMERLARDLPLRFGLAAFFSLLVVAVGLSRPLLALAAVTTVLLTVGLCFATSTVLGVGFDSSGVIVLGLGLGVALGQSVHLAARYQRGREEGAPTKLAALHYALTNAGHPVVLSSIVLTISLLILCLSSYTPTYRAGLLAALLMAYGTLLNLVLLPVLLLAADRG